MWCCCSPFPHFPPETSRIPLQRRMHIAAGTGWVGWPDRLVFVEVSLLEVAELGLQVLEVLRDALVLLCQPHVGLRILLLVLGIALLHINPRHLLLSGSTLDTTCGAVLKIKGTGCCAGTSRRVRKSGKRQLYATRDHNRGAQAPM